MPRVAVIIPCFNDGLMAVAAVRSVQEEEDVELVVVDDGSTDEETKTALAELAREGVTVLHKENGGPASARMAGLHATSAPYVIPLDADDLLLPASLCLLANALDAAPEAAFAYGDFEIFGDYTGYYRAPKRFDRWALLYANHIPVCSLIRRRKLVETGGWTDEGLAKSGYEDWSLWLAFAERNCQATYIGAPVYRRRLHGSRLLGDARAVHRQLYAELRQRYSGLFAKRKELRRESDPALWKRVAYPIVLGKKHLPVWFEEWLKRQFFKRGITV
jgi:glycosyltransferase involved in cell wall biosynthesis